VHLIDEVILLQDVQHHRPDDRHLEDPHEDLHQEPGDPGSCRSSSSRTNNSKCQKTASSREILPLLYLLQELNSSEQDCWGMTTIEQTFDIGADVELVAAGAEVHLGGRLVDLGRRVEETHGR
jgi:hypothetical protein